jgi:protein TonB
VVFDMMLENHPRPRAARWGIAGALLLHGAVLGALWQRPAQAAPPLFILPADSFPEPGEPVRRLPTGPVLPSLSSSGPVIRTALPGPIPNIPETPRPITGLPGTALPSGGESPAISWGDAWPPTLVQEAPVLLAAPLPLYPRQLREAGIQGQVMVEAVVDTLGRVEPVSIRIVHSDHAGFEAPARASLGGGLFRPARVFGRAVRVLVRVPVTFRIQGP